MYEFEQRTVGVEVKNLTNEANVTSFSMTCPDADVSIDQGSLASVTQLTPTKLSTDVNVSLLALPGMKRLSFLFQYTGINPTCQISISESITLAVKAALEIRVISLKPLFKYDWFLDLRRWDPSLGQSCGLFSQAEEDDGVTDSKYCVLSVAMKNCVSDTMHVEARLSNPGHVHEQTVEIRPETECVMTMLVEKVEEGNAQQVIDDRVKISWRSGDRTGSIGPLYISPEEAIHIRPSPVRFQYDCTPVSLHCFSRLTITAVSQLPLKGHFLYLYRYKEYRGRISLKPEQMILSGSLVVPFPEETCSAMLSAKFCLLEEGQYGFVAACGTRKRVVYWASEAFRVGLPSR